MNKEEIDELMEYNLEYLEARNSEDIFGGDYTSQVDLKYARKENERLQEIIKSIEEYIETIDDRNSIKLTLIKNDIKKLIKTRNEG